jgi:hypothetical protein
MSPRDLVYVGHMLDMAKKAVSKTQGLSRYGKTWKLITWAGFLDSRRSDVSPAGQTQRRPEE